jgi:hypothetical protein
VIAKLEMAMRTLSERVARVEDGQQRMLRLLEQRAPDGAAADKADVQKLREDVSRLLALVENQHRA